MVGAAPGREGEQGHARGRRQELARALRGQERDLRELDRARVGVDSAVGEEHEPAFAEVGARGHHQHERGDPGDARAHAHPAQGGAQRGGSGRARARHHAVEAALGHPHGGAEERVLQVRAGLVGHDPAMPRALEVGAQGGLVAALTGGLPDLDAGEVGARVAGDGEDLLAGTEQRDPRQRRSGGGGRGLDRPRLRPFRQHDVPPHGARAIVDALEGVHRTADGNTRRPPRARPFKPSFKPIIDSAGSRMVASTSS